MGSRTVLALAAVAPTLAVAQPSLGQDPFVQDEDSAVVAAQRAGRAVAEVPSTAGHVILSTVSGIAVGAFGPLLVSGVDHPLVVAGSVGGIAGYVGALAHGYFESEPVPEPWADQITARSPEYQRAFRSAYRDRLSTRTATNTTWGFLLGTGVTLGTLGVIFFFTVPPQ